MNTEKYDGEAWYIKNRQHKLAYQKAYRERNRDKVNAYGRDYAEKKRAESPPKKKRARQTDHPHYSLWTAARARANAKNLPFTISLDDIAVPETCPILGIPMFKGKGSGGSTDYSPTLDRVIPHLGYTPENVRVISYRANRAKANLLPQEISAIAESTMEFIQASEVLRVEFENLDPFDYLPEIKQET